MSSVPNHTSQTQIDDAHAHDHGSPADVGARHAAPGCLPGLGTATATQADDRVLFDFEKLDCYQVAQQFNALVPRLVPRGHRELRDQLTRAALSVSLNIAESAGRTARADKAHFIAIARGSAMECAAVVDILLSSGIAAIGICREARMLLIRTVQMLAKLEATLRR